MNRQPLSWQSVALWTAGTTLAWGVGIIPAMLAMTSAFWNGTDVIEPGQAIALSGGTCFLLSLLSGAALAYVQTEILKPHLGEQSRDWNLRTLISSGIGWFLGWPLGLLIVNAFISTDNSVTWTGGGVVAGLVVGLATGLTQWTILKRWIPGAAWWFWVTLAGWGCGTWAYWLAYGAVGGHFETVVTSYYGNSIWPKTVEVPGAGAGMLVGWLAGGLVLGGITGVALKLMSGRTHTNIEVTLA